MEVMQEDKWLLARYDDNTEVHLSSYSGGASETGAWGEITLVFVDKHGNQTFQKYVKQQ